MEGDQIAELTNELARVQEVLCELYPDAERLDLNVSVVLLQVTRQTYPELAADLARQNTEIVERLKQLREEQAGSETEGLKEANKELQRELDKEVMRHPSLRQKVANEEHVKTIEALARQIELYKSKTGAEVDRKLAAVDSKAKQEAKALKLENEHLKEMMLFKEEQIGKLQQEIDRLKVVMRVEAPPARKLPSVTGLSKLERKLDEAAETGRIEYHLTLNEGEGAEKDNKPLEKIMALPTQSLCKLVVTQAKMLEGYEKRIAEAVAEAEKLRRNEEAGRLAEEIRTKFAALSKERAAVERRINAVMEMERRLMSRFNQITGVLQEFSEDEKQAPQGDALRKKIVRNIEISRKCQLALKDDWKESLRYSSSEEEPDSSGKLPLSESPIISMRGSLVQTAEEGKEPKEVEEPEKNANAAAEEQLLVSGDFVQISENIRAQNYELPGQNVETAVQKLRIVCKVRDKQIEKLSAALADAETAKRCAELSPEEVNEIREDHEAVKAKYAVELDAATKQEEERRAELEKKVKTLESELAKHKKKEKGKDADKPQEAVMKELTEQLEEAKRLIKQKDDRIEELETGERKSETAQDAEAPGSRLKTYPKKSTASVTAATMAELEKNRALIKELMTNSGPAAQTKANKSLCEANAELNDKLRLAAEESDTLKGMMEDLSAEHTVAVNKLEQILTAVGRKNPPKSPPAPVSALTDALFNEIEAARRISLLSTALSFASTQGEFVASPANLKLYEEQAEKPRAVANDLYKEFFSEEKTQSTTLDSLLERIKKKNATFKSLFKNYETAVSLNESLMKSAASAKTPTQTQNEITRSGTTKSGLKPGMIVSPRKLPAGRTAVSPNRKEIEELKKQNEEQTATIKQLLEEIKGLKTTVEEKMGGDRRQDLDSLYERTQAFEAELKLSNAQLQETAAELDRRDAMLRDKDQVIESLEAELKSRMDEIRQLDHQLQVLKQSGTDTSARLQEFKAKYEKAAEAFDKAGDSQYEVPRLRQENQELASMNKLLLEKVAVLTAEVAKKTEALVGTSRESKELMLRLEEQRTALETSQRSAAEVHALLTQNMSEYKRGTSGYKEEIQTVKDRLAEKEAALLQWGKVLQKLKAARLEITGIESTLGFYSARSGQRQQEDIGAAGEIVDELREQIAAQKKHIESLQSAVNALQGERQIFFQAKSSVPKVSASPARRESEPDPQAKKYEQWIDSLQEPVRALADILETEHETGEFTGSKRPQRLSLRELREVIVRTSGLLEKLRDRVNRRSEEATVLKQELQRTKQMILEKETEKSSVDKERATELELRLKQVSGRLQELEETYERAIAEKARLESQLQKQKLDSSRLYDKVKEEIQERQKESAGLKLEKAREEGVLLGQKQQRGYREEELQRANDMLRSIKTECETQKATIAELEEYNKKANDEIVVLLDTLKVEQAKQRQLSADLEAITKELKTHRMTKTVPAYDNNY